jgi:prepilin-type N-terminal cleavage/methylation domain-containing protein
MPRRILPIGLRGFTLIELLAAIAIIGVLIGDGETGTGRRNGDGTEKRGRSALLTVVRGSLRTTIPVRPGRARDETEQPESPGPSTPRGAEQVG